MPGYLCCVRLRPSRLPTFGPPFSVLLDRLAQDPLYIHCFVGRKDNDDELDVIVQLKHAGKHISYEDVSMPPEALDMIRDDVEWLRPLAIVTQVQGDVHGVTAAQNHRAWMEMKHTDDVAIFEPQDIPEGVEMICWGMKKITTPLKGESETNSDADNTKHLELDSIMGEHDGAGFPLSYLLLSTASSIDQGKWTQALTAWAKCVRDTYGIIAKFRTVDKDMAGIRMLMDVWDEKISLCWWHLRRAVRTPLANTKLANTPYDPGCACAEFSFIDEAFVPLGQADGGEWASRGGERGSEEPSAGTRVLTKKAPSCTAPRSSAQRVIQEKENEAPETRSGVQTRVNAFQSSPTVTHNNIDAADPKSSRRNKRRRRRVPKVLRSTRHLRTSKEKEHKEKRRRHTFCPTQYREHILADLLELEAGRTNGAPNELRALPPCLPHSPGTGKTVKMLTAKRTGEIRLSELGAYRERRNRGRKDKALALPASPYEISRRLRGDVWHSASRRWDTMGLELEVEVADVGDVGAGVAPVRYPQKRSERSARAESWVMALTEAAAALHGQVATRRAEAWVLLAKERTGRTRQAYGYVRYGNLSHESARDTNFLGAVGSLDAQDGFANDKARLAAVSRAGNWTKLTAAVLSRTVPYYGRNFTKLPYRSRIRTVRGFHSTYRIRHRGRVADPKDTRDERDERRRKPAAHSGAKLSGRSSRCDRWRDCWLNDSELLFRACLPRSDAKVQNRHGSSQLMSKDTKDQGGV
ncbi:hypothetical protein B0H19DRAFT_1057210 [Mycena capillaripes]|nr:hypothetical protein B0H19DRAFT_1057210 [Mycena capillaripes]